MICKECVWLLKKLWINTSYSSTILGWVRICNSSHSGVRELLRNVLWRTIVDGFDRASHCHEVRAQLKQLHFRFLYANITQYILFDVVIVDCNCCNCSIDLWNFPELGVLLAALLSLFQNISPPRVVSHSLSFFAFCTSCFNKQVLRFYIIIILYLLVQGSYGLGPPSSFKNMRRICVVITTHQNLYTGNCFEIL